MTKAIIKEYARNLRNNSTLSEVLLWQRIKNRKIKGCKFLRQKQIGNHIVDIYCHQLKLVIEIDGMTNFDQEEKDMKREKDLEMRGIRLLRFGDEQVKKNIDGVIMEIEEWV